MNKKRDIVIDIARGIAIVFMIAANMATLSNDTPPMLFRFISSLAAPFFVTLAGTMAALGAIRGSHISHFLKTTLFLFVTAALLDLVTGAVPLINFDVLYLIGISLPIAALAIRLPNAILVVSIFLIIFITPILHYLIGYTIPVHQEMVKHAFDLRTVQEAIHRIFIDGWFPVFPWLSFALVGTLIGKWRYSALPDVNYFQQKKYIIAALIWFLIGAILWSYSPGLQIIREGYIELFYPTVPGFVIFTTSIIMITLIVLAYISEWSGWKYIQVLGEASLFMYLFHLVIIEHILIYLRPVPYGWLYLGIYLVLTISMVAIGLFLQKYKSKPSYKALPYLAKRLLGG
jgi:uncharacterized protein